MLRLIASPAPLDNVTCFLAVYVKVLFSMQTKLMCNLIC
jgi:hypothetical protein